MKTLTVLLMLIANLAVSGGALWAAANSASHLGMVISSLWTGLNISAAVFLVEGWLTPGARP